MRRLDQLVQYLRSKSRRELAGLAGWAVGAVIGLPTMVDNLDRWASWLGPAGPAIVFVVFRYGLTIVGASMVVITLARWYWDYRQSMESKSLVNPRYDDDVVKIDGKWKVDPIIGRETILIVTADTIIGELLDRPTAARIRDEIDRLGAGRGHRRAVIVGNAVLNDLRNAHNRELLRRCPMIAIGGESINQATGAIRAAACDAGGEELSLHNGHGVVVTDGSAPRAAIWGYLAEDTHAAAVAFMNSEDGLPKFLKMCWRQGAGAAAA